MTAYVVHVRRSVIKELARLHPDVRKRALAVIDGLRSDPRPDGVSKLRGFANAYRVRFGDYRVLYTITDATLTVEVVRIGARGQVYDDL